MPDYVQKYDFRDQVAVITGAGRGLGFSISKAIAVHGGIVILTDKDEALGATAAESLQADGLNVTFSKLDVRYPETVRQVASETHAQHGRLDIWINNAGVAIHGPTEDLAIEKWQLGIDVMLSGVFYGSQAAGQIMLKQGSGAIINIASVNGMVAQAGRAAYCAAKAGVIRLTEVLAAEWASRGVRVNAVAPAVFETDLVKASLADGSASMKVYLDRSPSGRLGQPDELLNTILYLASNHSDYVIGQTLRVDGGWVSDHYLSNKT